MFVGMVFCRGRRPRRPTRLVICRLLDDQGLPYSYWHLLFVTPFRNNTDQVHFRVFGNTSKKNQQLSRLRHQSFLEPVV